MSKKKSKKASDPSGDEESGFKALGLDDQIVQSLAAVGFIDPTPVQAAAIPVALQGNDIIAQARTGTGKTAAYLAPIFHLLLQNKSKATRLRAIVLAPTRELAKQISGEFEKLSYGTGLSHATIYGGVGYNEQNRALAQGVDAVVGTPGRIIDHMKQGNMRTDRVEYLVLDEADRMLDLGFRKDMEFIMRRCPRDRQTMLLSATMPAGVRYIANRYMNSPQELLLSEDSLTVQSIEQRFYPIDYMNKLPLLLKVIDEQKPGLAIVFCRTKIKAKTVAAKLRDVGIDAREIHGDLRQDRREKVMGRFRDGKVHILVATDVASRGIDVDNITHIIQYDIPVKIEDYVHRIGRTGRMESTGKAIMFVEPDEGGILTSIEMMINEQVMLMDRYSSLECKYSHPKKYKGKSAQKPSAQKPAAKSDQDAAKASPKPKQIAAMQPPAEQAAKERPAVEDAGATPKPEATPEKQPQAEAPPKKKRLEKRPERVQPAPAQPAFSSSQKPKTAKSSRRKKPRIKDEVENTPVQDLLASSTKKPSSKNSSPSTSDGFQPYEIMQDMAAVVEDNRGDQNRDDRFAPEDGSDPDRERMEYRKISDGNRKDDSIPSIDDIVYLNGDNGEDDQPEDSTAESASSSNRSTSRRKRNDRRPKQNNRRRQHHSNGIQFYARHEAYGSDGKLETFGGPFLSVSESEKPSFNQEISGIDWMVWDETGTKEDVPHGFETYTVIPDDKPSVEPTRILSAADAVDDATDAILSVFYEMTGTDPLPDRPKPERQKPERSKPERQKPDRSKPDPNNKKPDTGSEPQKQSAPKHEKISALEHRLNTIGNLILRAAAHAIRESR